MTDLLSRQTTLIIGGGAAGFFSAITTKERNPEGTVILIEKTADVLSKVKISGGGRCNVTHACFDPRLLCEYYPRGKKELLGPFHTFGPSDTVAWFESQGVPLKTESDGRMFPVSNSSQTIVDCLVQTATQLGVKIWTSCGVSQIKKESELFNVILDDGQVIACDRVVLATGSSRSGHAFAHQLGHTIEPPVPSLFTFVIADKALHALSGLSVAQAEVYLESDKKLTQKGPLLITHWGMSGPSIIKLSAWHARTLHACNYQAQLRVNWLPHFSLESLQKRLRQMQVQHPKKTLSTQSPFSEFPNRLWAYLVGRLPVPETLTWHQLNASHLEGLCQMLAQDMFAVSGKGVFKEEFVTCGGVRLKEVNFKTMESKVCPGLHIVGELLDIDGVTGGFNFQNAWTTGYLSGAGLL